MQITIISFTIEGTRLNVRLQRKLSARGCLCRGFTPQRFVALCSESGKEVLAPLPKDITEWIGEAWGKTSYVFIGASGIAIRYIAPWVKDKYTDSAVLSLDERGKFIIPLIGGHIGGAVALARVIAKELKGQAVITTATDISGKFAVDIFAKEQGLRITDRQLAKAISAAVLEGRMIGCYVEHSPPGTTSKFPTEVVQVERWEDLWNYPYGVAVIGEECLGQYEEKRRLHPGTRILYLTTTGHTGHVVAGIGCRRGITKEKIGDVLKEVLAVHGFTMADLCALASIDVKREEPGIVMLAAGLQIPFYTYSAAALKCSGEVSTSSSFVEQTVGVDNVCERAAKLVSPSGYMVQKKVCKDGISVALVEQSSCIPAVIVFAGTTEAWKVVEVLRRWRVRILVCVATEYGKLCLEEHLRQSEEAGSLVEILEGRLTDEGIVSLVNKTKAEAVIDATHPYAVLVTRNIKHACIETEVLYLRLLRGRTEDKRADWVKYVEDIQGAVDYLQGTEGNILIATGTRELKAYTQIPGYRERCYVRVLSVRTSVLDSIELGFQGSHLIAMQGPFSTKMNIALLEQTSAAYFVTKESGVAGGFTEKLEAAKDMGVQLVVIGRPEEEGMSMEELIRFLKGRYAC